MQNDVRVSVLVQTSSNLLGINFEKNVLWGFRSDVLVLLNFLDMYMPKSTDFRNIQA